MDTQTGFVDVDNAQLYYEMAGTGHPLVLIHAALMNSTLWDEQFVTFAQHYRVIRYDMRGFGRSQTPNIAGSDSDDLEALMTALDIDSAYVLGLSLGAEAALHFTLDRPARVDGLVLVGSGLEGYEYPPEAMERWQAFITPVQERNFAHAIDIFVEQNVDGPIAPASEAVRARARAIIGDYSFVHYFPPEDENTEDGAPNADQLSDEAEEQPTMLPASERLSEIRVPALIIVGNRDQPDALAVADVLAAGIPNAHKVVIPGAAHFVNLEQPEIFNRAVLEFLDALP